MSERFPSPDEPSHSEARKMASVFESGLSQGLTKFLATGEVDLQKIQEEIEPYTREERDPAVRYWAQSLGRYALRRVEAGDAGPLPGWGSEGRES